MATKKKAKKSEKKTSTALVRHEPKVSSTALARTVNTLNERVEQLEGVLTKFTEKFIELRQTAIEAPPPLFKLAVDIDYLRDHQVLLLQIEIENCGQRDLTLATPTLVCNGPRRQMDREYGDDVELEGDVAWARGGEVLLSGQIQTYVWAFEAPGQAATADASVRMRIGGQEVVESVQVQAFAPDRVPSERKAPKLLTGGGPNTVDENGLQKAGSEPGAVNNESRWR